MLAAARFKAEGRRLDLLLCLGFSITAWSTFAFAIGPVVGGHPLQPPEAWSGMVTRLVGAGLIAAAPFTRGRVNARKGAIEAVVGLSAVVLSGVWVVAHTAGSQLPGFGPDADGQQPYVLTAALAIAALLNLLTGLGFGSRFRTHRQDLDRWLALGATLVLFADLHYVFTPLSTAETVSQGDFLRLVSYCVLLVGVWRAIRGRSSGARSPRSAPASRARSTTGSRSTCSPSRRTRACSSPARRSSRRCRGSARRPLRRSRRRSSPCSRSRRRAGTRPSTRRSAATSSS